MKPQWVAALALFAAARTPAQVALPDSPGFVVAAGSDSNALEQVASPAPTSVPCVVLTPSGPVPVAPSATLIPGTGVPADRLCGPQQDQIRPFVDANKRVTPLTSAEEAQTRHPRHQGPLQPADDRGQFRLFHRHHGAQSVRPGHARLRVQRGRQPVAGCDRRADRHLRGLLAGAPGPALFPHAASPVFPAADPRDFACRHRARRQWTADAKL